MFGRKRIKLNRDKRKEQEPDIISCSLEEIRAAVSRFAKDSNQQISLRSIIKQNNEIDTSFLQIYLGGIPDKTFYMSKETFDIFEEPGFAHHLDRAQIACDQYVLEKGRYPVQPGDRTGKINYFQLKNYLKEEPPFDLYLHPKDRMVTHRKPADK